MLRAGKKKKEIIKGENILKELINILELYLGNKDHAEEFGRKHPHGVCLLFLPYLCSRY